MKFELNTTKEKLIDYLTVAERIAKQNASRSTIPDIEKTYLAIAEDVHALIVEVKTGQTDLIKK